MGGEVVRLRLVDGGQEFGLGIGGGGDLQLAAEQSKVGARLPLLGAVHLDLIHLLLGSRPALVDVHRRPHPRLPRPLLHLAVDEASGLAVAGGRLVLLAPRLVPLPGLLDDLRDAPGEDVLARDFRGPGLAGEHHSHSSPPFSHPRALVLVQDGVLEGNVVGHGLVRVGAQLVEQLNVVLAAVGTRELEALLLRRRGLRGGQLLHFRVGGDTRGRRSGLGGRGRGLILYRRAHDSAELSRCVGRHKRGQQPWFRTVNVLQEPRGTSVGLALARAVLEERLLALAALGSGTAALGLLGGPHLRVTGGIARLRRVDGGRR